MPEKVEKEIMDVMSNDWKSLSDTLAYFGSTLLSRGEFKGKGPDGVYYELRTKVTYTGLWTDFIVEDSTWASINGTIIPLRVSLHAFETEIAIKKETFDSTSLNFSKVRIESPDLFFFRSGHQAILFYEDRRVGFITREEFENTDYSSGTYIVVHYYDDPRTFALYDNGFTDFLKMSLTNAPK